MESGNHHDAYPPPAMACRAVDAGTKKANGNMSHTFALGVLAGAFIALGACFYTTVVTGIPPALIGPSKLVGGLCFSLGLILVAVGGAELFTGNILIVMSVLSGKARLAYLIRNWVLVYAGNFVGSLLVAVLAFYAWQWKLGDSVVGATAYSIAAKKLSLPFETAFCSGIMCNFLVCLAVWLCYSGRTVADKILAIIFPVTAFVALGFEHSVANMYFIPYGIMLSRTADFVSSPAASAAIAKHAPSMFTIRAFLADNLLPVTLGNIVGGGLLVGVIYWFIYLRGTQEQPTQAFILARAEADPASVNSQL